MKEKKTKTRERRLLRLLAFLFMLPIGMSAQNVAVKGNVVDEFGDPIIGATIVQKGATSNGTITDLNGDFTLSVPANATLVVSYIGMTNQEVKAVAGQTLKIILKDAAEALDEVVITGYGSRARRDLTGSVGSISGAKLAQVPVSSAAVALQGKIAGVQVTTIDGAPGAEINIRVRGGTSVTQSNEPLYIVDGFQADNINDIPPTDIQSIDVLKDASLTAIYGAKGGNGVVIVTTKSAQQGKIQVGVNTSLSVSMLSKKLDLMSTYDYVRYQYDWAAAGSGNSSYAKAYRANFGNPLDHDIYKRATTHDWQDEVMGETPLNYMTNITIGGGTDRFRFNTSLSQTDDRGIIMGSGVRRTNLNIKLHFELTKNLTLQLNPRLTYRRDSGAGGDNIGSGGVIDVLRYRPTNGLREFAFWDPATVDPDDEAIFEYTNPKNDIGENTQQKHAYAYTNQFSLDWKPLKGLTLHTEVGHYIEFKDENRFYGAMTGTGQNNNKLPVAQITNKTTEKYSWTNTAAYGFDFNRVHNLSFLLGQEIQHRQVKETLIKNRYFPRGISATEALNNMGLGEPWESTSSVSTPDRTASFFGQANYNYDHKYLASVTFRSDGSTKFAPGEQWGYFPAVSGAWVLSKESFLEHNSSISNLKLRAAIGMAGNNRISDDMWRYLYTVNSTGGPGFGETTLNGEKWYGNVGAPNMKVKWETTLTRNIAFDLGLFGDRVTITPEVYWNTTKDLLYRSDIPSVTGYLTQMQNIGQVTNRGFELTVNGDILRGKDYVLSGNLTFGFNKMKVDKLNDTDDVIWEQNSRWKSSYNDYCLKVGDEIGLIYGFVYDGIYGFDEFTLNDATLDWDPKEETVINSVFNDGHSSGPATRPGKIKLKDLSGPNGEPDGIIDEYDRTVIGNTNPKFQGGFGLSGQYKNFDFTTNFTYMYNFDVNNATAYQLSSAEGNNGKFYNVLSKFNNRWTYVNESGDNLLKNTQLDNSPGLYQEVNVGKTLFNPADVLNKVTHSYFIEDGSFLRCSDITLGYTLPKELTQKVGVSKLRVYFSASNLFIITGYSGYDPEVDVQTGLTPGMDYNRYPRNRTFLFGANITF
jgi:TonB-linked SusC/RagA family outer membrane protein